MARKTKTLMAMVVGLGLMALAGVRGQENNSQQRTQEGAARLREAVQTSARAHWGNCSGFLRAVIKDYFNTSEDDPDSGETYSEGGQLRLLYSGLDLAGPEANDQIDDISSGNWTKVDLHQAMKLADQGKLVVAALKGQPGHHGHVAVVMPGGPDPQTKWPRVAGGALPTVDENGVRHTVASLDGKSMTQVWQRGSLHPTLQVKFYTPKFTPQTVAVDVKPHPSEQPKAEDKTKGFTYDEDAQKLVGKVLRNGIHQMKIGPNGRLTQYRYGKYDEGSGVWSLADGNLTLRASVFGKPFQFKGRIGKVESMKSGQFVSGTVVYDGSQFEDYSVEFLNGLHDFTKN